MRTVTFSRHITYDLDKLAEILSWNHRAEGEVVTEDECLDLAMTYAQEDFGCGWGHTFDGHLEMTVNE